MLAWLVLLLPLVFAVALSTMALVQLEPARARIARLPMRRF
jgi:hypothetical protein